MFFFRIFKIFRTLAFFSVFPRCQCLYTHQAGRRPALQQNWQSSEKSQNFKEKNTIFNSVSCLLTEFQFINDWLARSWFWKHLRPICGNILLYNYLVNFYFMALLTTLFVWNHSRGFLINLWSSLSFWNSLSKDFSILVFHTYIKKNNYYQTSESNSIYKIIIGCFKYSIKWMMNTGKK